MCESRIERGFELGWIANGGDDTIMSRPCEDAKEESESQAGRSTLYRKDGRTECQRTTLKFKLREFLYRKGCIPVISQTRELEGEDEDKI